MADIKDQTYIKWDNKCAQLAQYDSKQLHSTNWRMHPSVHYMIGVAPHIAKTYATWLTEQYGNIMTHYLYPWDKIKYIDAIGNPKKHHFKCLDTYTDIPLSCITVRYLYIAHRFLKHCSDLQLKSIHVCELGVGVGIMGLLTVCLAPLYNINIQYYSFYDLHNVISLVKNITDTVASHISPQTTFLYNSIDCNDDDDDDDDKDKIKNCTRVLLSCYAFAEFPRHIKEHYWNNLIKPHCTHGFMMYNNKYQVYGPLRTLFSADLCITNHFKHTRVVTF